MAKEKFNPQAFKQAQEKSKEFGDVPAGTYNCVLEKAFIGYGKNNPERYQALFAWKIDPEDTVAAGQLIWQAVGLSGDSAAKGYEILSIIMNQLRINGEFNSEEEINQTLESRIGTVARISKEPNPNDTNFDKIRIVRLISTPDDNGNSAPQQTTNSGGEIDPNELDSNEEVLPEGAVKLDKGMKLELLDGRKVIIIALLEEKDAPSGQNSLMVYETTKAIKDGFMITLDQVKAVVQEEKPAEQEEVEEVDEDSTPEPLKAGDNVKGVNLKGESIEGPLRSIENGVAKVSIKQANGPNILTKCDVTKLVKA